MKSCLHNNRKNLIKKITLRVWNFRAGFETESESVISFFKSSCFCSLKPLQKRSLYVSVCVSVCAISSTFNFKDYSYFYFMWLCRGPFSEPCHNLVPTFSVWLCAGYFSLSTCYHLESPGKTDLEGPSQMWDVTSMGRWLGLWKKAEHCSGCGPSNRPSSWRLLQFLLWLLSMTEDKIRSTLSCPLPHFLLRNHFITATEKQTKSIATHAVLHGSLTYLFSVHLCMGLLV